MEGFQFIGVYSGTPPQLTPSPLDEPAVWNVYLKDNVYLLQKLDKNNKATTEQYKVSPSYFGINFRKIKSAPTAAAVKNDLKAFADKDKHESFFSSFFKSHAKFNSIFGSQEEKKSESHKKHSGEFGFQLGEKGASSGHGNKHSHTTVSSSKGNSQNLQINLHSENEKGGISHDYKKQNIATHQKDTSAGFQIAPEHSPLDEKLSIDAILNSLDKSPAPEHLSAETETPNISMTNEYGLEAKPINPETVLVHHETPNTASDKHLLDVDDDFFKNFDVDNLPPVPEEIKAAPISGSTDEPLELKDDDLLPAKGKINPNTLSAKAKRLDTNLRVEFQISLKHWEMGKRNMALRHFHNIINQEADYVPAHKHMFTDFAIKLRKINQHDLALIAAERCTKLSPDDSHAFFNVARLCYELGRYEQANEFIDKTLALESDLAPAVKLSKIIKECLRRKAINR